MRRLEAAGKGMLLLHDIHPATAAALPGLLQQLKDNGFHIVQVVPAASYEIAMAKRPLAPMPTSELRGDETIIGNGMDPKTQTSWPQTSANIAADDSALPVPDSSAFEPDALPFKDTADVQWPVEPDLKALTMSWPVRSKKSTGHMARGAKEKRRAERIHAHQHGHSRDAGDRNHADLMSRTKSVTAMLVRTPSTGNP